MSNLNKHILAFFPSIHASGQFKDYRVLEKLLIFDAFLDENDESIVFVTIWDCQTHIRMTSMTSSVERTDLDFKISAALITL